MQPIHKKKILLLMSVSAISVLSTSCLKFADFDRPRKVSPSVVTPTQTPTASQEQAHTVRVDNAKIYELVQLLLDCFEHHAFCTSTEVDACVEGLSQVYKKEALSVEAEDEKLAAILESLNKVFDYIHYGSHVIGTRTKLDLEKWELCYDRIDDVYQVMGPRIPKILKNPDVFKNIVTKMRAIAYVAIWQIERNMKDPNLYPYKQANLLN